jgi:hypothetical protein
MITRALGMGATVDVEVEPASIAHAVGDAFLLCSDGLSDLVMPTDMLRIALRSPPQQAARELVDLANERGGHDNITVMIVRALEAALAQPEASVPLIPLAAPVPRTLAQTENMPAVDLPSGARLPDVGAVSSRRGAAADDGALIPPAPSRPKGAGKRSGPPAIVWAVGAAMALVVVASVAIAIWFRPGGGRASASTPAGSMAPPSPNGAAPEGDAGVPDAMPRGRHVRNRPHR